MSMHKKPLTDLEREGLRLHGLDIGTPSQLSDCFRHGVKWALDSVATLQAERDALAAQSEQLQKLLHVLITDIEWHHKKTAFVPLALAVKAANFKDATKATPEQCLAAHDAEVAKAAYLACLAQCEEYFDSYYEGMVTEADAERYAASLNK